MASDIKVETFDKSFTNDGETLTLSNDVGDTSKAFVLNLTARRTSGGPTGSTGNTNWDDFVAGVRLTGTDELTFYRPAAGAGEIRMMGEVWRYVGSGGGTYEFVKRWSGEITIASGSTTNDQTISGVSDVNDVVCFVTGVEADLASVNDGNRVIATAYMTSSSNLRVERGETGTAVTVHVEVVEFTGSAWSIGHFDSGVIGSDNSATPTIYQSYDWTGSSFTVSDWTTAFIWADMSGDSTGANHALEDTWFVVEPNTDTTVLITLDSTAVCGRATGYVIQNGDLSVERETASKTIPEGLDTSLTDPSNLSAADESSLAESYCLTDGGGTAYARGAVTWKLNGTEVEAWVHRSGNAGTYRFAGIDLSGLESAGGTPHSQGVSDALAPSEDERFDVGKVISDDVSPIEGVKFGVDMGAMTDAVAPSEGVSTEAGFVRGFSDGWSAIGTVSTAKEIHMEVAYHTAAAPSPGDEERARDTHIMIKEKAS